ncbi:nucleoside hydrolase [Haloarcula halophila]|uniref:nucleoside hydrolase n=1 Tax=Haloarcula TaxID=2237 RepID=UPI0023E476A9|nr:nucleoside hydrolase [Halomicroarcula sp. DFY41]
MSSPLLIDADPGCDDAVALCLAAADPAIELRAVTTTHGNSTVENTTRNARAIVELFDSGDVPVVAGAAHPLLVARSTAEHIHGSGGIRGDLPAVSGSPATVETHAAQFIVEQARAHEGDLSIVAVGPLTNIALAVAIEPALPELLDELVVMGGTVAAHGNVTPLAEANFHSDPHAARKVIEECAPTVVGLDATLQATLSPAWIEAIDRETRRGRLLAEWLTYYDEEALARYDLESAPIHDAAVVAHLLDDQLLTIKDCHMAVGTNSSIEHGALACDLHGISEEAANGRVALDADTDRFRDRLTGTLSEFLDRAPS